MSPARLRVARNVLVVGLAIVLLAAAGLKAESALGPRAKRPDQSFYIAAAVFEWLLGTWLLLGNGKRLALGAVVVLFAAFTGVTASNIFRGERHCGCLGEVPISSGAVLALDVVALASAYLAARICFRSDSVVGHAPRVTSRISRLAVVSCTGLAAAAGAGWVAHGTIAADAYARKVVIIDLDSSRGKPMELLHFLEHAEDKVWLGKGMRTLLIVDHNCSECRALSQQLAGAARPETRDRIRCIDLSSHSEWRLGRFPLPFAEVKIRPEITVFCDVPLEVVLEDGVVKKIHRLGSPADLARVRDLIRPPSIHVGAVEG